MNKQTLRQVYRDKRAALSATVRAAYDAMIAEHLRQVDWSAYRYVHVFVAMRRFHEPDLSDFVAWLRRAHPLIHVVVSRSDLGSGTMRHFLWDTDTVFVENAWGIPEPTDGTPIAEELLDVVLVPLLVADRYGHRVGYGKGFYDRFLSRCRPDVQAWGVSYFSLLDEAIDADEWDVPLRGVVTPEGFSRVVAADR